MIVGISMMKDEADVVDHTVRRMAAQVDHLLVADNGSTDGTRDILADLTAEVPLVVVDDDRVAYYQSEKMSGLAALALSMWGEGWIVPFDADEVWSADRPIRDLLAAAPTEQMTVGAAVFDHVATPDTLASLPIPSTPWRRPTPAELPKVACRTHPKLVIAQGNHYAIYDGWHEWPATRPITIHHFPYRSVDQFCRKVHNGLAAYEATDLPPAEGAHWRQYGQTLNDHGRAGIEALFKKWFWRNDPRSEVVIEGERQPALVWDAA